MRQERIAGSYNNTLDRIVGIGDSVIALNYTATNESFNNPVKVSVGSGLKIPTGRTDVFLTGLASEDIASADYQSDIHADFLYFLYLIC